MRLVFLLLLIILVACAPVAEEVVEDTSEDIEDVGPTCNASYLCVDDELVYRNTDCSFADGIVCEHGCLDGACLEGVEVEVEEVIEDEECELGQACLDTHRRGYRNSNCEFSRVVYCEWGCTEGKCELEPEVEEIPEVIEYKKTEGFGAFERSGTHYIDFEEEQFLVKEVRNEDAKVIPSNTAKNDDYFRIETRFASAWVIDIGIDTAGREECMIDSDEATSIAKVKSGQTACIETLEGNFGMIGGYWDGPALDSVDLSWKFYVEE